MFFAARWRGPRRATAPDVAGSRAARRPAGVRRARAREGGDEHRAQVRAALATRATAGVVHAQYGAGVSRFRGRKEPRARGARGDGRGGSDGAVELGDGTEERRIDGLREVAVEAGGARLLAIVAREGRERDGREGRRPARALAGVRTSSSRPGPACPRRSRARRACGARPPPARRRSRLADRRARLAQDGRDGSGRPARPPPRARPRRRPPVLGAWRARRHEGACAELDDEARAGRQDRTWSLGRLLSACVVPVELTSAHDGEAEPKPAVGARRAAVRWRNLSSVRRNSGAMPWPVSSTTSATPSSVRRTRAVTCPRPAELHGVRAGSRRPTGAARRRRRRARTSRVTETLRLRRRADGVGGAHDDEPGSWGRARAAPARDVRDVARISSMSSACASALRSMTAIAFDAISGCCRWMRAHRGVSGVRARARRWRGTRPSSGCSRPPRGARHLRALGVVDVRARAEPADDAPGVVAHGHRAAEPPVDAVVAAEAVLDLVVLAGGDERCHRCHARAWSSGWSGSFQRRLAARRR